MALDRRVYSINFAAGLDQKTDKKLTTKLTTADNVVMRKNGTIEKRTGFVADGVWSMTLADLNVQTTGPVKVFPFNDGEFVLTDNGSITVGNASIMKGFSYALRKTNNLWLSKFPAFNYVDSQVAYPCSMGSVQAVANIESITYAQADLINASATSDGTVIFDAKLKSALAVNGVYAFDTATEELAKDPNGIQASWPRSALISHTYSSTFSYQFQALTSSIVLYGFNGNTTAWNGGSGPLSLFSVSVDQSNPQLDSIAIGTKLFLAAKQASTTGIILCSYDTNNGATSLTVIPASTTVDLITIVNPAPQTDRVRLIYMRNNASMTALYAAYSLTLSIIGSATTLTVGTPGYGPSLIRQLAACENAPYNNGLTTFSVYFTQSSTTSLPIHTGWNFDYLNDGTTAPDLSNNCGTTTGAGCIKNCAIAAKPFLYNNSQFLLLYNNATAQQSYVLTKLHLGKLVPIARTHYGIAGPLGQNDSATLSQLNRVLRTPNQDLFYAPVKRVAFFRGSAGSVTSGYGYDLLRINFSQTQATPYTVAADETYLGGGYLSHFDGYGIIESGFLSSPVIASVSTTTTGGSLGAAAGSYGVVILKETTDNNGRNFKGQPSLPVTFTTSTTTGQATVVFTDGPNFLSVCSRPGQIKYSVFRTTNGGNIYYRDTGTSFSYTQFLQGDQLGIATGITAISLSLTISDSTLSGNDILYTQGGALPNFTPDSVQALACHSGRLFCDDANDSNIIRYSKQIVPGEGASFALANIINVPGGGPVTAIGSMDSSLVGFKRRKVFIVSGSGPDDTGLNGTFSDGQELFSDVGCINQRNLCRFKDGIVFKSVDKGFYLLTRDLQLQFIGADVENYNSKTVVSSEVVAMTDASGVVEECRFLCSDGTLLTYNYYNGQWTTATLAGCTDAVQAGGRYVVVNPSSTVSSSGKVFQQSLTTYLDAFSNTSQTYQMTVETGFIKTADVQGFQRIWKVQGLGESMGGGRISVEVGYDYETAYNETYTFSMASMTTPNYTGGAESVPQFDFVPVRQKCQSIRFRIKDYPTENGAVMKLTNLSLECGVKSGMFKLPAAKGS